MPTLLLKFPGGRYHATPWGHHVNEGLVEWPPSPWRLLRALIACGYATQGWEVVPPVGRRLLEALAGTLPRYRLPEAAVAHTRHFMPTGAIDKGREKTTLVFDAWAQVGGGALAVYWDCELDDEALALLRTLASHLGYLGRSESWVVADVIPDGVDLPEGTDAYPHVDGHHGERGWEQISLMAPEDAHSYSAWRQEAVDAAVSVLPLPVGKRKIPATLQKARANAEAPFPVDLVECLQRDTAWWKAYRWSQPPGSRRVLYWRSSDALTVGVPARRNMPSVRSVTTILLALTTASGSRSALPTVARTLPQAELLHRALVAHAGRGEPVGCPELTGRGGDGRPLTDHHHAHVMPLDLDDDGHLEHILIHAPMGLGSLAQQAVQALRRTWTKGGSGDLYVAIAGQGDLESLRQLASPFNLRIADLLGPPAGSTRWTSRTPFVLPRHQKRRGANTMEGQLTAELVSRGLPAPRTIEVLPWTGEILAMRHAVRVRRHPAKRPPVDTGFAVRLVFDTPLQGPLSLGYASHFGLGGFSAEPEG